ncbi:MAG: hypothetical protein ACOCUH_03260 [Bacteriovoracia bacterium]
MRYYNLTRISLFFSLIFFSLSLGAQELIWKDWKLMEILFPEYKNHVGIKQNFDGTLNGADVVKNMNLIDKELFDLHFEAQTGENPDEAYKEYVRQEQNVAYAQTVLMKILDYEAAKTNLGNGELDSRTSYALRSVLLQNAFAMGLLQDNRHTINHGYEELYGHLVERADGRDIRLNITWDFCPQELKISCKILKNAELPWNEVRLTFEKLPKTWFQFEQGIKEQLRASFQKLKRQVIWQRMVLRLAPYFVRESNSIISFREMQEYYQAVKENFKLYSLNVDTKIFTIKNSLSKEEKKQLANKLYKAAGELQKEEQAIEKFLDVLNVTLSSNDRYSFVDKNVAIEHLSNEPLPDTEDHIGALTRMILSKQNFLKRPLPFTILFDQEGPTHIMVVLSHQQSQKGHMPLEGDLADEIRNKVKTKYVLGAYRKASYKLFKKFMMTRDLNFCFDYLQEDGFLCNELEPATLAKRLFPEIQFPDSNRKSSLTNVHDLRNIMYISEQNFNRFFQ